MCDYHCFQVQSETFSGCEIWQRHTWNRGKTVCLYERLNLMQTFHELMQLSVLNIN